MTILTGARVLSASEFKRGDRIRIIGLIRADRPLEMGAEGSVVAVHNLHSDYVQIETHWDNGRHIFLVEEDIPHVERV